MRLLDSVRRSGRSLRHAKLRTILTMLAISIGSFALALTLAAGEGARQFVDRLVTSNFNPQTILVSPGAGEDQDNPFAANDTPKEYNANAKQSAQIKPFTDADLQKMAQIKGIDRVSPSVQVDVQYISGPNNHQFEAKASSIDQGVKYEALAGQVPPKLAPNQAVLPEVFVNVLGFSSPADAIGKRIAIHFAPDRVGQVVAKDFEIVAVAQKPNGLLGGARDVVLSQQAVLDVYKQQSPTVASVYDSAIIFTESDNQTQMQAVQDRLVAMGYQALNARDLAKQITQAVNLVQYFVAGFGLIALVVSIFGIVNTQLISVLERTREIGLMKALGMSSAGILRLFVFEASWIGMGGAFIGVFTAYVAAIFVNPFLNTKLQLGSDLLVFVPLQLVLLVVALMVIAAIAGLLPAWKAGRLNPIEALRTE